METTEDNEKHDLEAIACMAKMQSEIWGAIKLNTPKNLSSEDQLICVIAALTGVLKGIAHLMTQGYGFDITLNDVLDRVLATNDLLEEKDEADA